MRSLFLKIFLWFWLSQLAMLAAFALAQRQWAEPPPLPAEATMRALAQNAAELLHQGSPRDWLAELNQGSALRFYLFDSRGRELGGRRPPREYVRQLLEHPEAARQRRHQAVQPLLVDGRNYFLVAARPPRSRLGELPPWARPAIAAAVSAGVCLLLAAYISRPVRRVRRAAQSLAAGELAARVDPLPKGADELAELSRDFNAMAARLQALIESQNRLLADVSHELRSPLARLQVALELARRRAGSDSAEALDRIELEAERLNELIAQVLTLARIESGVRPPGRTRVALDALCRQIVEDAAFEAGDADKRVELVAALPVTVAGDPALLRSAIENVVRNALRYTASGSTVEVGLSRRSEAAVIDVRDHGPGLPVDELERIFEPFVRASAARERDTGGYGLGLAIARRTVELYGGVISAENAADGGLRVILRLPAA